VYKKLVAPMQFELRMYDDYMDLLIKDESANGNIPLGVIAFAWGENGYGQLGIGSTVRNPVPIKVVDSVMGNTGVTDIVASGYFSMALKGGKV